jgi:hypothetical protein
VRLISEATKAILLRAFSDGKGIRAASRIAGVSHITAQRYFQQLGEIPACKCGLPVTHKGWCSVRFAASEKRQRLFGRKVVADERCQMCKELGFPDVLAHYKGTPAGMSHNGKAIPALCWDHKNGKVPKFIKQNAPAEVEKVTAPKGYEVFDPTKAAAEICGCGRPLPHKGRCSVRREAQEKPQAPPRPKKKTVPLTRSTTIKEEDITTKFPQADAFIGDSALRIPLESGELMLMFRGDTFELLQNKTDLHFLMSLVHTIQCRGKMMYPFSEKIKDPIVKGKLLNVQLEEGFVDDMISMMEPEDKARVLSIAWSKGL